MTHHFLPAADRPSDAPRTIKFEGEAFDTGISFFAVISEPGKSVGLHVHPYTETWIVQEGRVRFFAGSEILEATVGDIMVVPAGTPHGFVVLGDVDLKMMCIHDAPKITQTFLDPADA